MQPTEQRACHRGVRVGVAAERDDLAETVFERGSRGRRPQRHARCVEHEPLIRPVSLGGAARALNSSDPLG